MIYANDGYQHGSEDDFDFLFTDWLKTHINYTYQTINRKDFPDLELDPNNMVNIGLNIKYRKLIANFIFHYVDTYYEIYDSGNPVLGFLSSPQQIDSYNSVDARIAYSLNSNVEFSLAASNLFNNIHYESNPENSEGNPFSICADEIKRRITISVNCKF